jgi:hypothetical protein
MNLETAAPLARFAVMAKRKRRLPVPLPLMLAELVFASWTTVAQRSLMIAQGTCPPAEFQRMVTEKIRAAQRSSVALSRRRGATNMSAILAPWHDGATKNVRRLRKR